MNKRKTLSLILSILMLALPLASCSNEKSSETDPVTGENISKNSEVAEKPQLLTHIFRGTHMPLPEDYYISSRITPIYDKETGNITCFATYGHEVVDDEGNFVDYISEKHLVTLSSDGTILEDKQFENEGEENSYINNGVFWDDYFIYVSNSYDPVSDNESYYIVKYNLIDGSVIKSDNLQPLFSQSENSRWFYIDNIAVDNDGYIYADADNEVLVLDQNFVKSFSVFSQNWIDNLCTSSDGVVYASGYFENGRGFCSIDKQTKSFGTPIEGLDRMNNISFGEDYDIYYTDNVGLYGMNLSDASDGETENSPELIMNYSNSDVTENYFDILKVIDSETLLVSEQDSTTYREQLALYKKADDIDLSNVKVIEIASSDALYNNIPSIIVEYNKTHPESRVIVTDYSVYSTNEDYYAGRKKLSTDIALGRYSPDILIESYDSPVVSTVLENALYIDLYSFIDKDDTITRDDLFGSIKRTFDDDGKLWGLTREYSIATLIGTKESLGDRESWTFSEMLDFAMSLPNGVELIEDASQSNVAYTLFRGSGYGAFIDSETNTAHFNSPEFIKYLEYIATLPKEIDYSSRPDDYYQSRYLRYHNGEIALAYESIYDPGNWIELETTFNTKDFTVIGYPTSKEGELGSKLYADQAYIISSSTEYPEEAWDFIKYLSVPEYDEDYGEFKNMYGSLPILKSMYDKMIEKFYTYEFEFYYSGGASWGPYDPEYPNTDEMYEPGIRTYFTKEDSAKLKDFIDNKVGSPIVSAISDEITAIVNEEISSFQAGTRSAEATADIIQSRVSIWLAEHE